MWSNLFHLEFSCCLSFERARQKVSVSFHGSEDEG